MNAARQRLGSKRSARPWDLGKLNTILIGGKIHTQHLITKRGHLLTNVMDGSNQLKCGDTCLHVHNETH